MPDYKILFSNLKIGWIYATGTQWPSGTVPDLRILPVAAAYKRQPSVVG